MRLTHTTIAVGKTRDVEGSTVVAYEMVEGKWHVLVSDTPAGFETKDAIGFNLDTNEDD